LLMALMVFFEINLYTAGIVILPFTAYLGYVLNKRLVWKES